MQKNAQLPVHDVLNGPSIQHLSQHSIAHSAPTGAGFHYNNSTQSVLNQY